MKNLVLILPLALTVFACEKSSKNEDPKPGVPVVERPLQNGESVWMQPQELKFVGTDASLVQDSKNHAQFTTNGGETAVSIRYKFNTRALKSFKILSVRKQIQGGACDAETVEYSVSRTNFWQRVHFTDQFELDSDQDYIFEARIPNFKNCAKSIVDFEVVMWGSSDPVESPVLTLRCENERGYIDFRRDSIGTAYHSLFPARTFLSGTSYCGLHFATEQGCFGHIAGSDLDSLGCESGSGDSAKSFVVNFDRERKEAKLHCSLAGRVFRQESFERCRDYVINDPEKQSILPLLRWDLKFRRCVEKKILQQREIPFNEAKRVCLLEETEERLICLDRMQKPPYSKTYVEAVETCFQR